MPNFQEFSNNLDALFKNPLLDPYFTANKTIRDRVFCCVYDECDPYIGRKDYSFEMGVNNGDIAIEVVETATDKDILTINLSKGSISTTKAWDLFD